MVVKCLNCGAEVPDKFCSQCGQKSTVKRLSWKNFIEEGLHFLTHIDKHFLETTRQLVVRPGKVMKQYIDGRRKSYTMPMTFLIVWIALYLLIYHISLAITHYPGGTTSSFFTFGPESTAILNKYRTLIEAFVLPFTAFLGWLIVARPKLNYIEVVSAYFYITSFLFIALCFQILVYLALRQNFRTDRFNLINMVIYVCWGAWAVYCFFKQYSIRFLIMRLMLAIAISILVYFELVRLFVRLLVKWHI